jgi:hypothetical protein
MAKWVHDDVLDAALNYIKNNCTRMTACNAQPTTYPEGNATFALADVTLAAGDFTVADDTSGRKNTVAAKAGVLIDVSGTAVYIALLDVSNSKLLYVTSCNSQVLTAGGGATVDFPLWKINIQDPT